MGVGQFILLPAIRVQKSKLLFRYARLAFEKTLVESGLTYSIARFTVFLKLLFRQIDRVQDGKLFLVFGDCQ